MIYDKPYFVYQKSLPVRGAWIEIVRLDADGNELCRSPCGERGLKFCVYYKRTPPKGRSLCGERGLKSRVCKLLLAAAMSLPVRGAWIEISATKKPQKSSKVAPRAGSVD